MYIFHAAALTQCISLKLIQNLITHPGKLIVFVVFVKNAYYLLNLLSNLVKIAARWVYCNCYFLWDEKCLFACSGNTPGLIQLVSPVSNAYKQNEFLWAFVWVGINSDFMHEHRWVTRL